MKLKSTAAFCLLVITLASVCTTLVSCSGSRPQADQAMAPRPTPKGTAKEERQNVPIEELDVTEVYPTADGGAYVLSGEWQLWYVKGSLATRVTEGKTAQMKSGSVPRANNPSFALLSVERNRLRKQRAENNALQSRLEEAKSKAEENQ